jgi:hypothetical protein
MIVTDEKKNKKKEKEKKRKQTQERDGDEEVDQEEDEEGDGEEEKEAGKGKGKAKDEEEEESQHAGPSLYPYRTRSTVLSTRTNSTTATSAPTNSSEYPDSTIVQYFEDLNLEQYGWYWNLGRLTFGMAILIAGDILYNFPAGSLVGAVASTGTSYLTLQWNEIMIEYVIWFGLIGLILFLYTMICLVSSWAFWTRFMDLCFGNHENLKRYVEKTLGYLVILILLTLTICFDTFLFYDEEQLSFDYYQKLDSTVISPLYSE